MREVKVDKIRLTGKLEANRTAHSEEYQSALRGWQKEVSEILKLDAQGLDSGKLAKLTPFDPAPQDHTQDYTNILEALEFSVEETLTLDFTTFRQYVLDDWNWKESWKISTSKYLTSV